MLFAHYLFFIAFYLKFYAKNFSNWFYNNLYYVFCIKNREKIEKEEF